MAVPIGAARGAGTRGMVTAAALLAAAFAPGAVRAQSGQVQSGGPTEGLRLGPLSIMTQAPTVVDLGAGVYDLIGNAHRNETGAADAELRLGQRWWGIGPAVGVIADLRGGGMAYFGLDSDIAWGPVVVTPLMGFGAWWHGGTNDEELGGTFEFRLSLEAAYAFESGARLGLRFGHISNADIHRRNPGENDVMATYALPLGL